MCALGPLYTSFAPAGDPPSQSSGTLMSLQEGIAVLRARMVAASLFILSPRVSAQTPLWNHRNACNPIFIPGDLSAVPHSSIPLPASAHTLPKPSSPRLAPDAPRTHYSTFPERERERGRGEAGMFRRDIRVSEAERGRVPCRSKEHTASTRPTQAAS